MKAFYKTLAVATIGESNVSVTLASPDEPDCPMVACSESFLLLSGYRRDEVVGKNMRFLSRGCAISADLRHRMRISVRTGRAFLGVMQNRRKNGELFENLLYVTAVRIGSETYMLGIQHETKEHDVAQVSDAIPHLVQTILDSIFAATINAWSAVQVMHLSVVKLGLVRYVEDILQPLSDPARFAAARDAFVSQVDHLHCADLRCKNTFLEVRDSEGDNFVLGLRRVFSAPHGLRNLRDAVDSGAPSTNDSGSQVGRLSKLSSETRHKPEALTVEEPTDHPLFHEKVMALGEDGGKDQCHGKDEPSEKAGEDKAEDELTSLGSAGHPDSCKPCAFHCYSMSPCGRGSNCLYCHMEHPRRRRPRCQWRKGAKKAGAEKESAEGDEDSGAEAAEKAAPKVPLAPTPEGLMPLLVSLSHLSPLPFPMPPVSTRSTQPRLARVGETEADAARERDRLCIEYSESSIVISLGQRKETLPFVGGVHSGVLTFEVCPRLSGGLSLDAASGVIGGLATEATAGEGSTHTVVMKSSCGACAETYIFIRVVAEQTEAGDVLQTGSHSIEH